METQYMCACAK